MGSDGPTYTSGKWEFRDIDGMRAEVGTMVETKDGPKWEPFLVTGHPNARRIVELAAYAAGVDAGRRENGPDGGKSSVPRG